MTPVVLVEHPIPTMTERYVRDAGHAAVRGTRTVAGPVWVPLNGVPCPEPGCWEGSACVQTAPDDYDIVGVCERCNGLGVCAPDLGDGPVLLGEPCAHCSGLGFWDCDHGDRIARHGCQHCGGFAQRFGSGQVIQWKAHDKLLLPVVGPPGNLRIEFWPHQNEHRVMLTERGGIYRTNPEGGPPLDITDKVAHLDLRPGMFVARFDGLEAVEPAITAVTCDDCDGIGCWFDVDGEEHNCTTCHYEKCVPLDLQPGIVNHLELAA